jgi:hypothetical protein
MRDRPGHGRSWPAVTADGGAGDGSAAGAPRAGPSQQPQAADPASAIDGSDLHAGVAWEARRGRPLRCLRENATLPQAEQRSGIDAEFFGEPGPARRSAASASLAPRLAQRQREQTSWLLLQRVLGGQPTQVGDHLRRAAEPQRCISAFLRGGQPKFLQPGRWPGCRRRPPQAALGRGSRSLPSRWQTPDRRSLTLPQADHKLAASLPPVRRPRLGM